MLKRKASNMGAFLIHTGQCGKKGRMNTYDPLK